MTPRLSCSGLTAARESIVVLRDFDLDVAWLLDEERRSRFEAGDPAFETDFRLALTWLPPADETRRIERWLFDGLSRSGADWGQALALFTREAVTTLDLLSDALPEIAPLDDADLLTWLHDCVSPSTFPVAVPDQPMFLDAWLADAPLRSPPASLPPRPTMKGTT